MPFLIDRLSQLHVSIALIALVVCPQGWGHFKVHLLGGNTVALQSLADIPQKPFLTATPDGHLLAKATEIQSWEKFEVVWMEDGYMSLRSCAHGKYVCCLEGGGSRVVCNRDRPAEWEMLKMVVVAHNLGY